MKQYASGIILLFSAVIIETAMLSNITILPSVPDLMLIALLFISLKTDRTKGQILGFVSGLFLDLMSGIPLGFNCIVRTIIGYVAGVFGPSINSDGIFIPMLFGFFATLTKSLLAWIVSTLFPMMLNSADIFSANFIFEIVCNTLLTPIFFRFFSLFKSFLTTENGEQL